MISRLRIRNFKNLREVDVPLGPLSVLVGSNASGKSNLLEALRVIQGLAKGLSVGDTLNGSPGGSPSISWRGIRGGSAMALTKGSASPRFTLDIEFDSAGNTWRYAVSINPIEHRIDGELLARFFGNQPLPLLIHGIAMPEAPAGPDDVRLVAVRQRFDGDLAPVKLARTEQKSALVHAQASLPRDNEIASEIGRVLAYLENQQHLDLDPEVLRGYSQKKPVLRMGEKGEQFAAVVDQLDSECPRDLENVLHWLQELRPDEINRVLSLAGAAGDCMFALQELTTKGPTSAPSLSNGTLRFAALVVAYFQPWMPELLSIEEVENGIHPARIRLLVELLRSQSSSSGTQTLVSTHSPWLLNWLEPAELAHTLWFHRDAAGLIEVEPLGQKARVRELIDAGHLLGDLVAEGWLENSL